VSIAKSTGDDRVLGLALSELGLQASTRGDLELASHHCEEALRLLESVGDVGGEARTRCVLATVHSLRHDIEGAREHARAALEHFRRFGNALGEARAVGLLSSIALDAGELEEARSHLERCLALSSAGGHQRYEATALSDLARIDHAEGDLDRALERHARAIGKHRDGGSQFLEGFSVGYRGLVHWELGRRNEAREDLAMAEQAMRAAGRQLWATLFAAARCGLDAELDRLDEAEAHRREVEASLDAVADPGLRSAIALYEIPLLAARARRAGSTTREVDRRIDAILATSISARIPNDVRIALRLVARERVDVGSTNANELLVHEAGDWFALPGGERVACKHLGPPRRVLSKLAEERVKAPGVPVSIEALVQATWPGERMIAGAGRSRLYVAISTLRKLGLRDVVCKDPVGYLLSTALPLRRVRA